MMPLRTAPRPSALVQIAAFALLFLGGGLVGGRLAVWLAPGPMAAQFVGVLAPPLAFASGLQAWLGFAIAISLWRTLTRGPAALPREGDGRTAIPPGSIVFVRLPSRSPASPA